METNNFATVNEFEDFDNSLEDEKLIGWSATCLDQTISYYVDCNYNEISQDINSRDNDLDIS
uniref:Uncharacterized protein n=1 Tax=Hommersandiophycus borowitzkae TaxID=268573 RepID=A0A1G4NTY6_9FLOR|nr:Hypothetical protein ORF_8 [Hommersandiophycus borowitzkae]SCW22142.1 Hypothetical protein ORF_8 [Hommersandiophycus borowitzkae]